MADALIPLRSSGTSRRTSARDVKRKREEDSAASRKIWRKMDGAPKLGTQSITVTVKSSGEDSNKAFDVHEELLKKHSEFFRSALKKEWREGHSQSIALDDEADDPEIFAIFYHFLYTGQIFSSKSGDSEDTNWDEEWDRLADAFLLGDKLLSTSFKDAVTDAIIAKLAASDRCRNDIHRQLYSASSKASGVRRLCVNIAVKHLSSASFKEKCAEDGVPEFFCDVLVEFNDVYMDKIEHVGPIEPGTCEFHDHVAENKPCYKTMFS